MQEAGANQCRLAFTLADGGNAHRAGKNLDVDDFAALNFLGGGS
jgi:methylmalonyl-CoA mutase N-terminal domain/subunit